jgi:serine/threonine protein phosphatase PrpC
MTSIICFPISRTVLGQINDETGRLQAVALTRDQDGHNQTECMRVLSEHPVKEHKDIFAGGRLFGETPVTRCKYFNSRLKALRQKSHLDRCLRFIL